MKNTLLLLILPLFFAACSGMGKNADAYGNFEAEEINISSESTGKIIYLSVEEGDKVSQTDTLTIIDTANLILQKQQLLAQKKSVETQNLTINAQADMAQQQIDNINKDIERLNKMLVDGAATQKQLDDANGQMALAEKQKNAYISQQQSVRSQAEAIQAQIRVLENHINNSVVVAPQAGTVLQIYSREGELTVAGKTLFKLADMDNLTLRAYVSEIQLAQIKTGQTVQVSIDSGDELKSYEGKITWIASQAEFTPKIIQTKEERVKLVYAMKVAVKNDGSLKIGMPAELRFTAPQP